MKRTLLWLTLALTAALAAGCGQRESPSPTDAPVSTPVAEVPDHPVAQLMAGLEIDALTSVDPETLDPEELVSAVNAAAAHPGESVPDSGSLWWVDLELEGGTHLELAAGPEENLVLATLPDNAGNQVYPVADAALYELVRHSADRPENIDQEAAQVHAALLTRAMEDTMTWYADDPAAYTDYAMTVLEPADTYDSGDGSQVQFYDFRFCLIPQHPELVQLKGAAFLDGNLRVHDISPTGWLAVRSRDGETVGADFMGFSFVWNPEDETCLEELDAVLDRAERNAGLIVRVDYLQQDLTREHDYFQDEITDYNQKLLFRADEPVTDFRFFALDYGSPEECWGPLEGAALYSQENLEPGRPLVIDTNFPGDMPYRGFSFVHDGQRLSYTLSISGRDSSLVVNPLQ